MGNLPISFPVLSEMNDQTAEAFLTGVVQRRDRLRKEYEEAKEAAAAIKAYKINEKIQKDFTLLEKEWTRFNNAAEKLEKRVAKIMGHAHEAEEQELPKLWQQSETLSSDSDNAQE